MDNTRILIDAGLSEEQALVYDTLIEKGPLKASIIANWTGIKRSLVYKVLEQLVTMGLVAEKGGKGTVATFSPNHPSILIHSFEQKEKQLAMAKEMLTNSLGSLASKFNLVSGKPNVQFFEGVEAIKKITGDFPKKDKEICQFVDISLAMEQFKDETLLYLNKRVQSYISKRMIVSDSESNNTYVKKGSPMTEFRVAKNVNTFPTAVQVYDEKLTLLTLKEGKKIGLIIEDKDIAETFKIIFNGYWNNSTQPLA